MSKKKAILTMCIVSVVTALALIFSFISFDVAGKNYKYMGFAQAIYKGLDYDGGVYADYTAVRPEGMSDEDYNAKLDDTFKRIESILSTKNMNNAFVSKTSDGGIRVETAAQDDASDILTTIGAGVLKIRTSSSSTAEVVVSGTNVLAAFATQIQTTSGYQWGAYVAFDETATAALKAKTEKATSSSKVTLYMFRGESESAFFSIQVEEQIDGFMFISSSAMSQSYAEDLAIQMYCGSTPLTLTTVGNQVNTIGATYGKTALMLTVIALGALLVSMLVFFAVRYREFGLMLCLSTLLFVGLMLFLLQTISLFEVSLGGVAGVLASVLIFAALNIIPMEKIREEYSKGKKIAASVKSGYKKSYGLMIDISVVGFVTSLLCYFIGTGSLKTFSMGLLVGSLLALFVSIIVSKFLIDSYVAFNRTNEKRVNLKREEGIDEIG